MKLRLMTLASLAVLLLGGCSLFRGIPVPAEYSEMVGSWEGNGVELTLTADGGVAYEKLSGAGSFSLTAPLREIGPEGFRAGVLFIGRDFRIDRLPWSEDGERYMAIDGDLLRRRDFGRKGF